MPLDAELQPIVDLVNAADVGPPGEQDLETLRESFDLLSLAFGPGAAEVECEGVGVSNAAAPIGLRVYRAVRSDDLATSRPGALVWFHGGGWVIGNLESHDACCRDLCAASGATVISVDYRRAPEHAFPTAHDDASAALRWIVDHAVELEIDPTRIAVGGDSAGAHLATVAARRARDAGGPELVLQVLVYPVTDLTGEDGAYPSRRDNGSGYVLTWETMEFFRDSYTPDPASRTHPDASPMLAEDLTGLPPALVLTAELDPLRDEGEAYAARLAAAGVETVSTRYDGAVHMFFQMGSTAIGRRAIDEVAEALRARLSR